jgi:hypothetical protein
MKLTKIKCVYWVAKTISVILCSKTKEWGTDFIFHKVKKSLDHKRISDKPAKYIKSTFESVFAICRVINLFAESFICRVICRVININMLKKLEQSSNAQRI